MRNSLNFSPLFRSTIGFDRVFDLLENASRGQTFDNWPTYDIARTGDDTYRITMALAGFSAEDLSINQRPNLLVVSGKQAQQEAPEYLHQGISGGSFERQFELADHVEVADATLRNGLLTISLVREIPEEMKPRQIQIKLGDGTQGPKQISGTRAA